MIEIVPSAHASSLADIADSLRSPRTSLADDIKSKIHLKSIQMENILFLFKGEI